MSFGVVAIGVISRGKHRLFRDSTCPVKAN